METEHPHAQVRRVHKLDLPTPLIAPSFSSYGFPYLSDIWEEFKHKLYGICLVSAFDMAGGRITGDAIDMVNVVILDSGLYESRKAKGEPGTPPTSSMTDGWTRARYHKVVEGVGQKGNVILVNFDHVGRMEDQMAAAFEDFSRAPQAATDFLVKPTDVTALVNLAGLSKHQKTLGEFSVIGITAREIGSSFLKRCRAVVTLRDLLDGAELETPIHVFGAISPYEVLTYFFCGADIFDGLNWLRLAFRDHASITIGESAMEDMKWDLSELDLCIGEWTENLRFLHHLQERLKEYGTNGDLESLIQEFPIARQAAHIAELAGAEFRR